MSLADRRYKLNTGAEIPALGLGTWQASADEIQRSVYHAIEVGYRHIDTALAYQNEEDVGKGIKAAIDAGLVTREQLFVTTKLWNVYANRVEEGLDTSLKSLGLDYVDLFLVHWPVRMNDKGNHPLFPKHPDGTRDIIPHNHVDTWKAMEALPATGKTRAVGVSNYSVEYLEQLLPHVTIVPAVNQIENHPQLAQQEIVEYCQAKGILIEAYSPLGSTGSPLLTAEPIVAIAKKKGVAPATVLLSWHLARGSVVLAKSVNPDRITANRTLIELDADDVALIKEFSDDLKARGQVKRYVAPPFGVDLGFPDKW
ncbi:putative glycerol dehydrogenase [Talaromyces proteolyticus]|uniref:D-xylose reductase [NAD(P)H] n=1 Tax=Talaromyces proteolyticus TaxID=1131652 RepID=A0AAD4KH92_9EURO|nr:putative glycerol dehydrogenase [Talaromyces proteolyticus]KAH8691157.1 putative glycerol dehydrogenase [Talaromyces proteolyticus]